MTDHRVVDIMTGRPVENISFQTSLEKWQENIKTACNSYYHAIVDVNNEIERLKNRITYLEKPWYKRIFK